MEQTIYSRYSCRKFTKQALSREQLINIMRAGMQAPSARNEQPWEFIAVTEKQTLLKMAKASPYATCLREAAAAVLVMADTSLTGDGAWWIQDISACIENMLLETVNLGLGSVWLGMYPRQDRVDYLRKIFKLPAYLIPVAVLPLGYPLEAGNAQNRYKEERIHWEGFGEERKAEA
ncbi:MAG: nitroreductase family protein [Lachnospiraceae bacterium]|nr:nitroreductase family protein [Lachnospiraceae bacterium]